MHLYLPKLVVSNMPTVARNISLYKHKQSQARYFTVFPFFKEGISHSFLMLIGVRDQFFVRGGGGLRYLLPEYFLHRLPENQMVLPEYQLLFARKIVI